MRMYFFTMSLRVLCVVSLFWVRGPWIILVGAGAVVLPYVAVLIANAVSHTGGQAPEAPTPRELGSGENGEHARPAEGNLPGRPSPENGPSVIVVDAPAERRSSGSAAEQPEQPRENGTPA